MNIDEIRVGRRYRIDNAKPGDWWEIVSVVGNRIDIRNESGLHADMFVNVLRGMFDDGLRFWLDDSTPADTIESLGADMDRVGEADAGYFAKHLSSHIADKSLRGHTARWWHSLGWSEDISNRAAALITAERAKLQSKPVEAVKPFTITYNGAAHGIETVTLMRKPTVTHHAGPEVSIPSLPATFDAQLVAVGRSCDAAIPSVERCLKLTEQLRLALQAVADDVMRAPTAGSGCASIEPRETAMRISTFDEI